MSVMNTIRTFLSANRENSKFQVAYFNNGQLYKVVGGDEDNWYDAEYIVSDGKKYSLNKISDIRKIKVPNFRSSKLDGYGITGSLDYVLRMKAGKFFNRGEKELCSACLWKSTELMLANDLCGWKVDDFNRIVNWHLDLGMTDEAKKAKEYLQKHGKYTENSFDRNAKQIISSLLQNSRIHNFDLLVVNDYGNGCCAECAKTRSRVYSISGKTKGYPKLPDYARTHGNFHKGCRCTFSPYFPEMGVFYKGDKVDAIKSTHRPWRDDRDEIEIEKYDKYLKSIADRERSNRIQERDRFEYSEILSNIPDNAPKSFWAYRRMKSSNTKNFIILAQLAEQNGIKITPYESYE